MHPTIPTALGGTSSRFALLLLLTVAACTSGAPAPGAGRAGGTGGAGGAGGATPADGAARGGTGGGGAVPDGSAGAGASRPDVSVDRAPPDAPVALDTNRTPDAIVRLDSARSDSAGGRDLLGGPGCAQGSVCWNLRAEYAEAVMRAKSCTVGAPGACEQRAAGHLGCGGCAVWVNQDRAALDVMAKRFYDAACDSCVYGSPTGDRCHPTICGSVGMGGCVAGPGGQGTCVNQERICPPGTMTGALCPTSPPDISCRLGASGYCGCRSNGTWICF